MGPRKRPKPNPKAETRSARQEEAQLKGIESQTNNPAKIALKTSLSSDKPEGVEHAEVASSGANNVSAKIGQLVQTEINLS